MKTRMERAHAAWRKVGVREARDVHALLREQREYDSDDEKFSAALRAAVAFLRAGRAEIETEEPRDPAGCLESARLLDAAASLLVEDLEALDREALAELMATEAMKLRERARGARE